MPKPLDVYLENGTRITGAGISEEEKEKKEEELRKKAQKRTIERKDA